MTGEPLVTIVGNLTADPELRFTPSGAAVANFTVASTPRTFNRQTNQWDDGEALFMRCSIWRDAAENVAESLSKGMRVVVHGKLKSHSYEKDGQKRTSIELEVDEVGPSLRWASAKVTRADRTAPAQAGPDPWATQQGQPPAWGQQAPQAPQQPQQQPLPQAPQQAPQYAQSPPGTPWGGAPAGDHQEPPFAAPISEIDVPSWDRV